MSAYTSSYQKSTHVNADPRPLHIDLSSDNELPALLEENEALAQKAKLIETRRKANRKRIEEKLGRAATASLPGWFLARNVIHRKGYSVAASTYSYVVASRQDYDFG